MWRVALAVGVLYLATIRPGHEWGDDFAQYIQHARNITAGLPYAQTGYIYNPHNSEVGPRSYPPGFPVLLAPVVAVFGLDFLPMKVLIILCFVGVLLLLPLVFRRDLPPAYAVELILCIGLNPFFWDFKDQVMSDIPFLLFILLSFYAWQREKATLAGAAAYAASATRVLGFVLLPCFIADDLIRRRRISKTTVLTCGIAVGLAGFQYLLGARDASYFDQLAPSVATVGRNLVFYVRALSDFWDDGYTGVARKGVFLITAGLAAYGYVRALRARPTALEFFPALYLTPILLWPAQQGSRFLIPLIPFYLYYGLLGVRGVQAVFAGRQRALMVAGAAGVGLVLVVYGAKYTTLRLGPLREGVATPESVALFEYVKASTAPTDIFIFSKPRALALFTSRRASAPVLEDDSCSLWRYIRQIGATYVITGPPLQYNENAAYLERFVSRFPQALQRVMGNDQVAVYRISGDPCRGSGLGLVA